MQRKPIGPAQTARKRRQTCCALSAASLRISCWSLRERRTSSAMSISRGARKNGPRANDDWIDGAARALSQVRSGMRRNLLRSLSLDAMAVSLSER